MGQCSIWGTHNDHNQIETASSCAAGTLKGVNCRCGCSPFAPHSHTLPDLLHPSACGQSPECDQSRCFTSVVTSAVRAVPSGPISRVSIPRRDFSGKHPRVLHAVSSHPARQAPSSPHGLRVPNMCSVCT